MLVNAMHITASVFINDDEPGLHADYEKWLERLAPHEPTSQYRHNRTGEDNADAPPNAAPSPDAPADRGVSVAGRLARPAPALDVPPTAAAAPDVPPSPAAGRTGCPRPPSSPGPPR